MVSKSMLIWETRSIAKCLWLFLFFGVWSLLACAPEQDGQHAPVSAPAEPGAGETINYNSNSWQNLIPEDCRHFFDGCNTCTRAQGAAMAACTRKACAKYQQPRCLDQESDTAGLQEQSSAQLISYYVCDEGKMFSVFLDEYRSDDQIVKLDENEIMLSDLQTRTAYKLQREQSASGVKYSNGTLRFWSQGAEATLQQDGENLYHNCIVKP